MKEKDFENIGERLYKQEAEPPKDGFSKIRAMLVTPTSPTKTIIFKNWWKPLVILIPLAVYLTSSDTEFMQPIASTLLKNSLKDKSANQKENERTTYSTSETNFINEAPKQPELINRNKKEALSSYEQAEINSVEERTVDKIKIITTQTYQEVAEPEVKTQAEVKIDAIVKHETALLDSTSDLALKPITENILKNSSDIYQSAEVDSLEKKLKTSETPDEEIKNPMRFWRLSALFSPQYITKNIRPILNDEIFLASASKKSNAENVGFSAAIGIGRSITSKLFVDASLSYTQIKQAINLSYTTGKVDTMLAIQQPDQTIILKPVYEFTNREITQTLSYSGFRLAGTYYFWSHTRSRFNLSASVVANYLVSAHARQRIDNQWVDLNTNDIDKLTYNVSVGAGYSVLFHKGLELQINPTLTYFMKNKKSEALPYSNNQQSIGLQVMLFKKIGMP